MSDMKTYEGNGRGEIFSRAVRAGKRTYFFDVKATRNNDLYLTITESKKRFSKNGKFRYEKHKLFLYKEDFDKFANGLEEVVDFIRENIQENPPEEVPEGNASDIVMETEQVTSKFTDVDFDDLEE